MPESSSLKPKVRRISPVTLSMPTEASRRPSVSDTSVLSGAALPMPMKAAKARK